MRPYLKLVVALLPAMVAVATPSPAAPGRESVALVLAGGGARGLAHAGVIRALEELRIPVDSIAGTSMGALVGGLYATGMDADKLRGVIDAMDWQLAFKDSIERKAQPPRRKSDDYDYATPSTLSLKNGRVNVPLGIVQGQQVRQIIKALVYNASHVTDFDLLPIPFRAVATDIETGDAYIFGRGDLVTALRASMSLPGILAPVEYDGKLLVDGGMAMNIPVEVGRQMGGQQLIVVDIGTPLKSREEITSVLGVTDQVLGFLTRKNSVQQLSTLGPDDVLISPDLDGIGMLDFDRAQEIYRRGYEATMALADRLSPLALDASPWQAHLARRTMPEAGSPVIDYVAIRNDSGLSDDLIRVRISQPLGETLDRRQLNRDIASVYALDYWQLIDYQVQSGEEGTGLVINARAKSWGSDNLKLGLSLLTDLDGVNEIDVGASYLYKGVNELGGELYSQVQLGDTLLLRGGLYQPLDLYSRYFLQPHLAFQDYRVRALGPDSGGLTNSLGEWRVRSLRAELAAGMHIADEVQLRLGLFRTLGEYRETESGAGQLEEDDFSEGGLLASLRYDTLDDPFFPTSGSFLYADYDLQRDTMGADSNFERWRAIGLTAFSFGTDAKNTVILSAKTGQSIDAVNSPQNYFQLGGLFNLSGLSHNFFSGRQMAFAMAQYQRRLSETSVLPLDLPIYAGASIEGGQLWSDRSDIGSSDFITAGSLYFAIDSPLGPLYLAYGRTETDQDGIYLSLGWPFLTEFNRVGR